MLCTYAKYRFLFSLPDSYIHIKMEEQQSDLPVLIIGAGKYHTNSPLLLLYSDFEQTRQQWSGRRPWTKERELP